MPHHLCAKVVKMWHHLAGHVEMACGKLKQVRPDLELALVAQLHVGRLLEVLDPVLPGVEGVVLEGDVRVDVLGRVVHRHLGDAVKEVLQGQQPFLQLSLEAMWT